MHVKYLGPLLLLVSVVAIIALGSWLWTSRSTSSMTLAQALSVAREQQFECEQKGIVGQDGTYNPNSKTWWIDFMPGAQFAQSGCSPACVVSEETKTASINWRCTGVILPASYDDLITIDAPLPGATITSPVAVSGRARGAWYFEAQFPIKLYDGAGTLIAQEPAHAQGEWTTSEYVPFTATLAFVAPTTATGTLIIKNDNPSGNPQNAKSVAIPVVFGTRANFQASGNVTKGNPGQRLGVWYLTYERPGAPALSVQLDLNSVTPYIELSQGERVHVEGVLQGNVVTVFSITSLSTTATTPVKLYYYNPSLDQGPGGTQCSSKGLVAVNRTIPKTSTPLRDTIQLLIQGKLTDAEKQQGITTEFPLSGLSLTSATITNGEAVLTFSDPQNKTSGGSCRAAVLWAQIAATAKQFPSVTGVRFQPATIFQP